MRILSLLVLILSVQTLSQAQNIEFSEFDLKNGLHVILHEDNSTPIVAVSILYHVGAKNENPERTGFAHFFEHLLFEGSENIKRGQFDELITGAGGMNNAATSWDYTYYYEVLPSNQLELGLYLESERLLHAKIDSVVITNSSSDFGKTPGFPWPKAVSIVEGYVTTPEHLVYQSISVDV